MITAGIDCGARNTKTVIMENGKIIGFALIPTGFDQEKAVDNSYKDALNNAKIAASDVNRIFGTGSGRDAINIADELVNNIKAMGKAAHHFFPDVRTVADIGAEEGCAAKLDARGNPADYVINERCASGAGIFIEAMSRALDTPIDQFGPLALKSEKQIALNTQCVVFAETEVVGLMHSGTEIHDISKAVHDSLASRIVAMIRRVGVNQDVALLGGVANNPGFVNAVRIQLEIDKIFIPDKPEFGGAVGAALCAAEGI